MNIIGLDIGGTKCALSVPDGPDRVREVVRFATTDVHGTLDRFFAEIAKLAPADAPQPQSSPQPSLGRFRWRWRRSCSAGARRR